MKTKRFLFLVMAICLASGVKAQYYDSADDIYYYVEYEDGEYKSNVKVFNFDGRKACVWNSSVSSLKSTFKDNPNYYEDKVETTEYELRYRSSNTYMEGEDDDEKSHKKYTFSSDRNTLTLINHVGQQIFHPAPVTPGGYGVNGIPLPPIIGMPYFTTEWHDEKTIYKKVDKSYFKVGRSRTPSSTMYE